MNQKSHRHDLPDLEGWDWKHRIGGWGLKYNEAVTPWILCYLAAFCIVGVTADVRVAVLFKYLFPLLPVIAPLLATVIGLLVQDRLRWQEDHAGWRLILIRYWKSEAEVHVFRFNGDFRDLVRAMSVFLRPGVLDTYARNGVRITMYSHLLEKEVTRSRLREAFASEVWHCIEGETHVGPLSSVLLSMPACVRSWLADYVGCWSESRQRRKFDSMTNEQCEVAGDPIWQNWLLIIPIILRGKRKQLWKLTFVPFPRPIAAAATGA